jgi:hypothetical protein
LGRGWQGELGRWQGELGKWQGMSRKMLWEGMKGNIMGRNRGIRIIG